jgi:hypothetical protein
MGARGTVSSGYGNVGNSDEYVGYKSPMDVPVTLCGINLTLRMRIIIITSSVVLCTLLFCILIQRCFDSYFRSFCLLSRHYVTIVISLLIYDLFS